MLCLACHDGTGSIYDVVNAVYAGFGSTCSAVYYHPVKGLKDILNNPAVGEIIECTYCHNPHGDSVNGQVYPRLLRSFDGTNRYYQGPEYCLACHGAVDHNFTGETDTYWENTLGDHRNSYAAHYITAEKNPLLPPSGTKVTCIACHNKHAAPNSRLLAEVEENLCWSCHWKTEKPNEPFPVHPVTAFSKTGSVHNVDGAGGSKLECSSCHGPHTINYLSFSVNGPGVYCYQCHPWAPGKPITTNNPYSLQGPYSVLSDPDNTKKKFAGAEGTGLGGLPNTVGDLSDFCIKCHDDSPPTAVADVYTYVPYTIVFPATNFTTNSGGWDKGIYKTSAHGTASSKITCGECHESHGSNLSGLAAVYRRYGRYRRK
jgi:predicted CXXCH cytochrome family protein